MVTIFLIIALIFIVLILGFFQKKIEHLENSPNTNEFSNDKLSNYLTRSDIKQKMVLLSDILSGKTTFACGKITAENATIDTLNVTNQLSVNDNLKLTRNVIVNGSPESAFFRINGTGNNYYAFDFNKRFYHVKDNKLTFDLNPQSKIFDFSNYTPTNVDKVNFNKYIGLSNSLLIGATPPAGYSQIPSSGGDDSLNKASLCPDAGGTQWPLRAPDARKLFALT